MRIGARAGGTSGPRLRGLVAVVAVLSCPPAPAAEPTAPKLVVVIYPDSSDGSPGMVAVNRVLRETLAGESPRRVEIHNEYVDTSRLPDAEFRRAQAALLRHKYAGRKIDLVVAGLSSGLDFVLE